MEIKSLDKLEGDALQEGLLKLQEYIRSLESEVLLDRLVKALDNTEVILEGYNLVTNINEGHGIAVAGIIKLREALAEAIDWIDYNCSEEETDTESDEL
jgi:hypothetical protein